MNMSVFSKAKGFLSRHKNKFIAGGIVIAGSILLTRYAKTQLRNWQEKETIEFLERNRKQSHFESINRTCNQTVLNLSSALLDKVFDIINTEEIVESLKANPENKLQLWNSLKVKVFTKAGYLVYAIVMLVVTLKIQLNIVGGYLYKDPNSVTTEMQENYLSLCQNFLNSGTERLAQIIQTEVEKVLSNVDLKKQMKLGDIEAIFWSMQSSLATGKDSPIDNFREYMFTGDIPSSDDLYNNMLRDTADLLDSEEVKILVTHCVNRGFVLLGDQIAEFFTQNGAKVTEISGTGDQFENPFGTKKPMAKLIPILNGLLTKQSFPQNLLQTLINYEKLLSLSANVYESLL